MCRSFVRFVRARVWVYFALVFRKVRWGLWFSCCVAHPAVTFRAHHVLNMGGYRPGAAGAEDYDLWLRLANFNFKQPLPHASPGAAGLANLPCAVLHHRKHAYSATAALARSHANQSQEAALRAGLGTCGQIRRGEEGEGDYEAARSRELAKAAPFVMTVEEAAAEWILSSPPPPESLSLASSPPASGDPSASSPSSSLPSLPSLPVTPSSLVFPPSLRNSLGALAALRVCCGAVREALNPSSEDAAAVKTADGEGSLPSSSSAPAPPPPPASRVPLRAVACMRCPSLPGAHFTPYEFESAANLLLSLEAFTLGKHASASDASNNPASTPTSSAANSTHRIQSIGGSSSSSSSSIAIMVS
mmetsp:Transcript_15053/g.30932  ORF Transcript_15053/g.30932 Transcript_15053/m.30932 type:complete len:360 (+) Transcript_15053:162-1241(+)